MWYLFEAQINSHKTTLGVTYILYSYILYSFIDPLYRDLSNNDPVFRNAKKVEVCRGSRCRVVVCRDVGIGF